jgi:hypothetical protein
VEVTMMGPDHYGQYYWCVKTKVSKSREIYVNADHVEFTQSGGVIFWRDQDADDRPRVKGVNLSLAAGQWTAVFAASAIDGHAVAVQHWEGEVSR